MYGNDLLSLCGLPAAKGEMVLKLERWLPLERIAEFPFKAVSWAEVERRTSSGRKVLVSAFVLYKAKMSRSGNATESIFEGSRGPALGELPAQLPLPDPLSPLAPGKCLLRRLLRCTAKRTPRRLLKCVPEP